MAAAGTKPRHLWLGWISLLHPVHQAESTSGERICHIHARCSITERSMRKHPRKTEKPRRTIPVALPRGHSWRTTLQRESVAMSHPKLSPSMLSLSQAQLQPLHWGTHSLRRVITADVLWPGKHLRLSSFKGHTAQPGLAFKAGKQHGKRASCPPSPGLAGLASSSAVMQRIHMGDIKVQSDGSVLSHPVFGVRDQKKP